MENKEKSLVKSLEEITAIEIKHLKTEIKSVNGDDIVLGFTIEDKNVEKVEGTFTHKDFGKEEDSVTTPDYQESSVPQEPPQVEEEEDEMDGQASDEGLVTIPELGEEDITFTQDVGEPGEKLELSQEDNKNGWVLKKVNETGLYKGDVKVTINGKEKPYRVTLRKINEDKKVSIEKIEIKDNEVRGVGSEGDSQPAGVYDVLDSIGQAEDIIRGMKNGIIKSVGNFHVREVGSDVVEDVGNDAVDDIGSDGQANNDKVRSGVGSSKNGESTDSSGGGEQAVTPEPKTYTLTLSNIKVNNEELKDEIVELKSEKFGIITKNEEKEAKSYKFIINKEIEDKEVFDVVIKKVSGEIEKREDVIATTQIILIRNENKSEMSEEADAQIFSKENPQDKIEGKQVSSSFKSTGVNTGELTINDKSILTKFEPESNKWSTMLKLSSGSVQNIILKNEDTLKESKSEAIFAITFNGKTPMGKIIWSFDKLKGETYNPIIEALNFVNNPKVVRNGSSFKLEAKFNLIPSNESFEIITEKEEKGITSEEITIDNFKTGSYTLRSNVKTRDYAGIYEAGINVNVNPVGITIRDNKLNIEGSAEVLIETSFFDDKDKQNLRGGALKYKEKGSSGNFTEINLTNEEVNQKYLVKRVEGLREGIYYEFLAQYLCVNKEKQEAESLVRISSNIIEILIPKKQDENKKDEIKIEVDKENSKPVDHGISIEIPSNVSIDKEKNIELGSFKYKDKDGNIVTQPKEEFSNVTVKFEEEKMVIDGLVPGKKYEEITVDYVDKDGKVKTLTLKDVVVEPQSKLDEYLPNVYDSVFSREADEAGYHYHLERLESGETSIRDFLRSIIDGEEFGQNKNLGEKVDDLYSAIVGRDSDEEGKRFWMEEYNKTLNECGSDKEALKIIVDKMVNENELKEIAEKLDVKW